MYLADFLQRMSHILLGPQHTGRPQFDRTTLEEPKVSLQLCGLFVN